MTTNKKISSVTETEFELKQILKEEFNLILDDSKIADFHLKGDEDYTTLYEYASDYANEIASEKSEAMWNKRIESDEFDAWYRERY